MRVNLLGDKKSPYSIDYLRITVIISVILFLFIVSVHFYLMNNKYTLLKIEAEQYKKELSILEKAGKEYEKLTEKVRVLENYKKEIGKFDYYWPDVLIELGFITPSRMSLIYLEVKDRELILDGTGDSHQDVIGLMNNMKESPYFTDVKLIKIEQIKELQESSFTIESRIVER